MSPIAESGLGQHDIQRANRDWWTGNPMTYDWRGTSIYTPGTREWFEEIDRRFLSETYFAKGTDGTPFGRWLKPSIAANKAVLEVGCGMGTHAALLAQAGANLTAIDITESAVEMTRRRFDLFGLRARIEQADAEELPYPDASFDTIWSWGVIHHSRSTERCLDEMTRVLKPGGTLFFMVYNRHSLWYYGHCGLIRGVLLGGLRQHSLTEIYHDHIDGAYARLFTRGELEFLLKPAYEDVETVAAGQKGDVLPIPASPLKDRLKRLLRDEHANTLLRRVGFFLVTQARKRADSASELAEHSL
jgi:SAM-dependent methyltransferase